MAGVDRLGGMKYLNMIGNFAKAFGLDPDLVYHKSFDTVTNFLVAWKEEAEFSERYAEIERLSKATQ